MSLQISHAVGLDNGLTLYTPSWCGICKRAKAFLNKKRSLRRKECGETGLRGRQITPAGGSGVPLITVGSQIKKGFDPCRRMEMWQSSQVTP